MTIMKRLELFFVSMGICSSVSFYCCMKKKLLNSIFLSKWRFKFTVREIPEY